MPQASLNSALVSRRVAAAGILVVTFLSSGCVTHDLEVEARTLAERASVVPPSVRRLSTERSPLEITSQRRTTEPEAWGDVAVHPDGRHRLDREPDAIREAGFEDRTEPERLKSRIRTVPIGAGNRRIAQAADEAPGTAGRVRFDPSEVGNELPSPPQPTEEQAPSPRLDSGASDIENGFLPPTFRSVEKAAPIDFGSALSLTAGQNPEVRFARERVDEANAQLDSARVLWLPTIRAGANFNKHEGRIQDVAGKVFETSRIGTYGGLGARGVGSGSPTFPGVSMQFHLADAVYEPMIAKRRSQSLERASRAKTNDELLQTALAYLDLMEAVQAQAIARETLDSAQNLSRLTSEFARTGAGNLADADRAATVLAAQRNRLTAADAHVVIASSRLAQQLRFDPATLLLPSESNVVPVCLVETKQPVRELIATGLSRRPELSANRLLVDEAVQRLRREKNAVWLPSVFLGMDYGGMGGGFNNQIVDSGERFDFDAVAYWEVRNLGFGEKAARDRASSRVDQARLKQLEVMDAVAQEVVEFHARAEAAQLQIDVASDALESARQAARRDLERIREGQGLPIESLQSQQALDAAQREYLRSTIDYNRAQFQLQRALGWPVQ